jgi:hypothetical protein
MLGGVSWHAGSDKVTCSCPNTNQRTWHMEQNRGFTAQRSARLDRLYHANVKGISVFRCRNRNRSRRSKTRWSNAIAIKYEQLLVAALSHLHKHVGSRCQCHRLGVCARLAVAPAASVCTPDECTQSFPEFLTELGCV